MLVYPKVVGAFEKLSKKYLGSTTSTSFWKDAPPSELKQRWIHALGSYVENKLNLSSPSKPSQSWSGLTEEQKVECVLQFINKEVFVELGYVCTPYFSFLLFSFLFFSFILFLAHSTYYIP